MPELFDAEQYRQQQYAQQRQLAAEPLIQPHAPLQHQGQGQQPHMMQPQTPVHHMPPPPVFAPPPGPIADSVETAPKKSRFSLKRASKLKAPKAPRFKKSKQVRAAGAEVLEDAVHTTNTSPAMIFMFGMATGIVCFLVGNMLMTTLLTDNSPQSFRDIERQNAQAQQPVLPKSARNIDGVTDPATP